jgi:hypothetical protein
MNDLERGNGSPHPLDNIDCGGVTTNTPALRGDENRAEDDLILRADIDQKQPQILRLRSG